MRLGRHPRKEPEGDATGDGRHSSSSARLSSARGGDDAVDDLNTEHAGRFGRLRKEISGPINYTRLALMIKLSSQLILIKVNNTWGVTKTFRDVRWNFVECSRIQKVLKVFCETFQIVELEQVTLFIDKLSKKHFRMFWRKMFH